MAETTEPVELVSVKRAMRVAEFRAALREFQSRTEEVARNWGLTPQRYLLLLFVKGAAGGAERATLSELTERMKLSPNTVTELVIRAEEAGLVRRRTAKHDLRFVHVSLTAEGESALGGAMAENAQYRRGLARRFDALESAFRAALRR
jgi:DNA-binding MarR family transcriptional regulator